MIINLMPSDIKRCRKAAEKRVAERTKAGALTIDEFEFAFKCHYSGVLGEFAVCKAYDCAWLGEYFEGSSWNSRTLDTAVGEVRATFWPDLEKGMRLYLDDDRLKAPYIWVTLQERGQSIVRAKLVGWIIGINGHKNEWWHTDKNYWVVPRQHLNGIQSLPV